MHGEDLKLHAVSIKAYCLLQVTQESALWEFIPGTAVVTVLLPSLNCKSSLSANILSSISSSLHFSQSILAVKLIININVQGNHYHHSTKLYWKKHLFAALGIVTCMGCALVINNTGGNKFRIMVAHHGWFIICILPLLLSWLKDGGRCNRPSTLWPRWSQNTGSSQWTVSRLVSR